MLTKLRWIAVVLTITSVSHIAWADPPTIEVDGEATLGFDVETDDEGNITDIEHTGTSADFELNGYVPIVVPTSIRSSKIGTGNLHWSNAFNWDSTVHLIATDTFNIGKNVQGAADNVVSVGGNVQDSVETLQNTGPTARDITLDIVEVSASNGYSASIGAGAKFRYDVLIPGGADVILDQEADLERLTVESTADLTRLDGNSVQINKNLENNGFLGNFAGTVNGDMTNSGTVQLLGDTLTVNGGFHNSGSINIDEGGKLRFNQNSVINDNRITVYDGQLESSGLFTNFGSITLQNGSLEAGPKTVNRGTFYWEGGSLGDLHNRGGGQILVDATSDDRRHIGYAATLVNEGRITHTASDATFFDGGSGDDENDAVLENRAGAVYDLQSDGNFEIDDYEHDRGTIVNAGLFHKSGGSGKSRIEDRIDFRNTGTFKVTSGTLAIHNYSQTTGQMKLQNANLAFPNDAQITGGSIVGTGKIVGDLHNTGATISPGTSPGTLTIDGNYTQQSAGEMLLELAGTEAGEFDVLEILGDANLDGTLSLRILDDFSPEMGESFDLLKYKSRSGGFSEIDVLGSAYEFEPTYNSDGMTLTTTAVPEPGTLALIGVGTAALLSRGTRRRHAVRG